VYNPYLQPPNRVHPWNTVRATVPCDIHQWSLIDKPYQTGVQPWSLAP